MGEKRSNYKGQGNVVKETDTFEYQQKEEDEYDVRKYAKVFSIPKTFFIAFAISTFLYLILWLGLPDDRIGITFIIAYILSLVTCILIALTCVLIVKKIFPKRTKISRKYIAFGMYAIAPKACVFMSIFWLGLLPDFKNAFMSIIFEAVVDLIAVIIAILVCKDDEERLR